MHSPRAGVRLLPPALASVRVLREPLLLLLLGLRLTLTLGEPAACAAPAVPLPGEVFRAGEGDESEDRSTLPGQLAGCPASWLPLAAVGVSASVLGHVAAVINGIAAAAMRS